MHTTDLDRAADALAAAFEDYHWTRHALPEADYFSRLRELQRLYLGYALEHGVVAVTDNCDGVIALLAPDALDPEPEMIAHVVSLHGDRIDRLEHSAPRIGVWRLETLGVRPEAQGGGRATALLDFALSEVTRRGGIDVVPDSSDPRNVRLYERHGFTVGSHSERVGVPPAWSMTRR